MIFGMWHLISALFISTGRCNVIETPGIGFPHKMAEIEPELQQSIAVLEDYCACSISRRACLGHSLVRITCAAQQASVTAGSACRHRPNKAQYIMKFGLPIVINVTKTNGICHKNVFARQGSGRLSHWNNRLTFECLRGSWVGICAITSRSELAGGRKCPGISLSRLCANRTVMGPGNEERFVGRSLRYGVSPFGHFFSVEPRWQEAL